MAIGIPNRVSGEIYTHPSYGNIIFDRYIQLPEQGKFQSSSENKNIVNELLSNENVQETTITSKIQNISEKLATASQIALFETEDAKKVAFVKYVKKTGPKMTWDFTKETGYVLQKGASTSERIPYKPSDILTESESSEKWCSEDLVNHIIETTKQLGDEGKLPKELSRATESLVRNAVERTEEYTPNCAKYRSIIEKYLGELLAPIMITTSEEADPLVTGDFKESEKFLVSRPSGGVYNFSDMFISFPTSKNSNLFDSELVSRWGSIGVMISSKDSSGGFAASIQNVYNMMKESEKQYDSYIKEIVETIAENDAVTGPPTLAKSPLFNLLTESEAEYIIQRGKGIRSSEAKDIPESLKRVGDWYAPKLTKETGWHDGSHLVSAVAAKLASIINADDRFSDGVSSIINKTPVVQVYAKTSKRGDGLRFNNFNVVYPPNFQGKIYFWSGTRYQSGSIQGKIGFKLKSRK